jgi:hypothetical protein
MTSPLLVPAAARHLTHPARVDSAGPEATALAASAGLHLDPWQADVLDVGLAEQADGRWAAREVGLVVPRQNGKGSILEALIVAALVLFEERLILYSAHEFKTAQETFLRVKSLIESSDDLMGLGPKFYNAHGSEGVEFRDGQRLRFVARSKGSGRGFSPQRIILDEALNLSPRSVAALLFSMSAQDNPQIWYTSSHPEDTVEGQVLRRLMRRGRAGDESLAYIEYCADDGADPADSDAWGQANPGFPHRISPETIATERGATDPEDFNRERLGVIDLDAEAHKVIPAASWSGCLDGAHRPAGTLSYALDVSPGSRSCAIAASDGTHLEVVKHETGIAWVVPACLAKRDAFTEVVLDPAGPAVALIAPLEAAGITVRKVKSDEAKASCAQFLSAVEDRTARHLGQPELDAAVANADRKDIGDGGWLWSRVRSSVDISPLVAVTLARWAAGATQPVPTPGFVDLNDFDEE